jgi:hypothetical protein
VAHKLAIAAYHILKKQEPFREELMFRAFQEFLGDPPWPATPD